jgi:hypothetical protein
MKFNSNKKPDFRIRKNSFDDVEEREFQKSLNAYYKHLNAFKKSSNRDLWKYFYWDFFHDSELESITIGKDFKSITMKLHCRDIKRLSSKLKYGFKNINLGFTCTFREVINFETQNIFRTGRILTDNICAEFISAEINTSPLLKKFKTEKNSEYSSLAMQFVSGKNVIWMEIVFSSVVIKPKNPSAFSLMQNNPKYEIPPLYSKKKK